MPLAAKRKNLPEENKAGQRRHEMHERTKRPHTKILQETKMKKKLTHKWLGHILRMDYEHIAKKVLQRKI